MATPIRKRRFTRPNSACECHPLRKMRKMSKDNRVSIHDYRANGDLAVAAKEISHLDVEIAEVNYQQARLQVLAAQKTQERALLRVIVNYETMKKRERHSLVRHAEDWLGEATEDCERSLGRLDQAKGRLVRETAIINPLPMPIASGEDPDFFSFDEIKDTLEDMARARHCVKDPEPAKESESATIGVLSFLRFIAPEKCHRYAQMLREVIDQLEAPDPEPTPSESSSPED